MRLTSRDICHHTVCSTSHPRSPPCSSSIAHRECSLPHRSRYTGSQSICTDLHTLCNSPAGPERGTCSCHTSLCYPGSSLWEGLKKIKKGGNFPRSQVVKSRKKNQKKILENRPVMILFDCFLTLPFAWCEVPLASAVTVNVGASPLVFDASVATS